MKTILQNSARSLLLAAIILPSVACVVDAETSSNGDGGINTKGQLTAQTCALGETRSCDPGDPELGGEQTCLEDEDGLLGWGECESFVPQCDIDSEWNGTCCQNMYGCCEGAPCNTPLVMAFDNQRVSYHQHMRGSFDLTGKNMSLASDWPTAKTPWLALDRDGNGRIDSGAELFGSATRLGSGQPAQHGFEALRELDSNRDGRIDARDDAWSKLRLWHDRDASRSSAASELSSLMSHQLLWISLDYHRDIQCDLRGNCEGERAQFAYLGADGQERLGTVIDVYLRGR